MLRLFLIALTQAAVRDRPRSPGMNFGVFEYHALKEMPLKTPKFKPGERGLSIL